MNQTIPPEIVKFLDKIDSPVLLVKGEPGSGKTILTLQYIADQAEKGYGIYFPQESTQNLSTASSPG